MIRIGKMKKRITISNFTEAADTYGEPVRTWIAVGTRWAEVVPLTAKEFITAKQLASQIDIIFRTRWTPVILLIKPKMKITYNNQDYNIESAINVQNKNRVIEFLCSKIPV